MFSYYGSKSKIIQCYPAPVHSTIVEPFAGSARYALRYFKKKVILNDSYSVIADVWNWLIEASVDQIQLLPNLKPGDDLREFDLTDAERSLLGFMVHRGVARPGNNYNGWASKTDEIKLVKKRMQKYCACFVPMKR